MQSIRNKRKVKLSEGGDPPSPLTKKLNGENQTAKTETEKKTMARITKQKLDAQAEKANLLMPVRYENNTELISAPKVPEKIITGESKVLETKSVYRQARADLELTVKEYFLDSVRQSLKSGENYVEAYGKCLCVVNEKGKFLFPVAVNFWRKTEKLAHAQICLTKSEKKDTVTYNAEAIGYSEKIEKGNLQALFDALERKIRITETKTFKAGISHPAINNGEVLPPATSEVILDADVAINE